MVYRPIYGTYLCDTNKILVSYDNKPKRIWCRLYYKGREGRYKKRGVKIHQFSDF